MLNRYSTTSALELTLRPSRYRPYLLLFMASFAALATASVYLKGYPILAIGLLLGSAYQLYHSLQDPMDGAQLKWEAGEWFISHHGRQSSMVLLPGTVRLPWLIYMAFRESHAKRRWRLWLFVDSADMEKMRGLRVRLGLER